VGVEACYLRQNMGWVVDGGEGRWKRAVGVAGRDEGGQLQVRCKLLFGKRVCRPNPPSHSLAVRRVRRACH